MVKNSFIVILKAKIPAKLYTLKVYKDITGVGLREAKDAIDSAPTIVATNCSKYGAVQIKKMLEETGATIEIK